MKKQIVEALKHTTISDDEESWFYYGLKQNSSGHMKE